MDERFGDRSRLATRVAIILLAAATLFFPVWIMGGKSITGDEVAHIPAGYSYIKTGIVRLNPMHPPLVKELCALPLLAFDPELPVGPEVLARPDLPVDFQWEFGDRFFDRDDFHTLVVWARLPAVLLSFGLALLIAAWARELWGASGAFVALFLYAFDPTITAHAQLVTTDIGVAFFATAYLYCFRRCLLDPSPMRLLIAGLTLGLALGSKFSAVALLPISALLMAIHAISTRSRWPDLRLLSRGALMCLVMGITAYIVLWTLYLFPTDPLFYLHGLHSVNVDRLDTHEYLLGSELSREGWPYYLLVAWLLKTPLPTIILFAGALVALLRGARTALLDEAFIAVPLIFLFVAYSTFSDPIGVRYTIPCFPFVVLFIGRIATSVYTWKAILTVAGLLVWLMVEYFAIWPDHLSYFNQVAGGSRGGVNWLDDSNVDWGQGLVQLRQYLEEEEIHGYRTCLFPQPHNLRYGVAGDPISFAAILTEPPPPGVLVISAHCLARAKAYLQQWHGNAPQNWLQRLEPVAVVGHAIYVYDIPDGGVSQ